MIQYIDMQSDLLLLTSVCSLFIIFVFLDILIMFLWYINYTTSLNSMDNDVIMEKNAIKPVIKLVWCIDMY